MTVEKPKPMQLLQPITAGAISAMNQSQFLAITCNSLEAREKSRVHVAIGFVFAPHWLKNWGESFKPITKRSNRNHVITFDSHLKTALYCTMSAIRGIHLDIRILERISFKSLVSSINCVQLSIFWTYILERISFQSLVSSINCVQLSIFWTPGAGCSSHCQRKPLVKSCLLYTSPSPRDLSTSRMPSSA